MSLRSMLICSEEFDYAESCKSRSSSQRSRKSAARASCSSSAGSGCRPNTSASTGDGCNLRGVRDGRRSSAELCFLVAGISRG